MVPQILILLNVLGLPKWPRKPTVPQISILLNILGLSEVYVLNTNKWWRRCRRKKLALQKRLQVLRRTRRRPYDFQDHFLSMNFFRYVNCWQINKTGDLALAYEFPDKLKCLHTKSCVKTQLIRIIQTQKVCHSLLSIVFCWSI